MRLKSPRFERDTFTHRRRAGPSRDERRPQDFIENVVVKIADEVEVDVSTRAWKVSYADALPTALRTAIGGVEVPYLDLATLIASKDTYRDQDRVDVQLLREIARRRPTPEA